MKKILKSALSFLLVAVMVLGAAPLSGFVGLELPKFGGIDLPEFSGFEKIKTAVSDFFEGFSFKADAITISSGSGVIGDTVFWEVARSSFSMDYYLNIYGSGNIPDYSSSKPAPWSGYAQGLSKIYIGYGITGIGNYAFEGLSDVTEVDIPDTITLIGHNAFKNCLSLETITIPYDVTYIGTASFENCSNLKTVNYNAINALSSSANPYVFGNNPQVTTLNIGENVEAIDDYLFYNFKISKLAIPNSVTSIGKNSFANCSLLKEISISENVSYIGDKAFYKCNLKKVTVDPDNSYFMCDEYGALLDKNKTRLIIYPSESPATSYTIPESVKWIDPAAFYNCDNLTDVVFPPKMTYINDEVFYDCDGLKNLVIPENITEIYTRAFYSCSSLESVTIPSSVTEIQQYVFFDCISLASVSLPSGLTSINDCAFGYCESLPNITIPSTVTQINRGAFLYCVSLTSISIPSNVTRIGDSAFIGCSKLINISLPKNGISIGYSAFWETAYYNTSSKWSSGMLYIGTNLVEADLSKISSYVSIKSGTTTIADSVFSCYASGYEDKITSITIPSSMITIGTNAFGDNYSLTTVSIPSNVKRISSVAFGDCINLKSVTFNAANCEFVPNYESSYHDYDPVFSGCDNLSTVKFGSSVRTIPDYLFDNNNNVTSVTIPDSVTNIEYLPFHSLASYDENGLGYIGNHLIDGADASGDIVIRTGTKSIAGYAFEYNTEITSVEIPYGIKSIEDYTFRYCNIEKVTLPSSIISIGEDAFCACKFLTDLTIPSSVKTIGDYAFEGCELFTKVSIPTNVTNIGTNAFNHCIGLESISVVSTNQYYSSDSDGVLFNKNKTVLIKYPEGNEAESYTIPNTVKTIGESAFYSCNNLRTVNILENVETISDYAFDNCYYLRTANISDSVTTIGDFAFSNCHNLKNINIPEGVTTIGDFAFYNCSKLETITIPGSAKNIGTSLFSGCSKLENVIFSEGVTTIPNSRFFDYCTSLRSLYIPASMEPILSDIIKKFDISVSPDNKYYSTDNCGVLFNKDKTVLLKYPSTNTAESYTVPATVRIIEDSAFKDSVNLKSISLPESLTSIKKEVFIGCTGLTDIVIPNSVKTIGTNAFYGCSAIETLHIGSSLISLSGLTSLDNLSFITVDSNNNRFSCDENGVLFNKNKTVLLMYPEKNPKTAYNVPATVSVIGAAAFSGCDNLENIILPGNLNPRAAKFLICRNAFNGCNNLSEINIPTNTYIIGGSAFSNSNIQSISIPGSVQKIGSYAFSGCSSLSNIILSEGIQGIGSGAFKNCDSLVAVTIPDTVTQIDTFVFSYSGIKNVVIGTGVSTIGKGAFTNCSNLYFINIPGNVTHINESVFQDCTNLECITIGKGVTNIGNSAFENCSRLSKVYYIGSEEEWKKITIGSKNEKLLNAQIIYNCVPITGFEIEDSSKAFDLFASDSETIQYVTTPEDAPNREAYWTSSDPQIAKVDKNGVVTGVSEGTATITGFPYFTDGTKIFDTCTVTVSRKSRNITAPAIESKTGVSCVLSAVTPSAGDGTVEYGWSLQNDSSTVTNWQTDVSFTGLSTTNKYYFFCRVTGSSVYADAYSPSTDILLSHVPVEGISTLKKNGSEISSAVFGETLTASFDIEGEYTVCWYRDSEIIDGVVTNTYTLSADDVGHVITVIAKGDETKGYTGTITSNSVTVGKAATAVPSAPMLYEATENSITIIAENGKKYKRDDRYWITPEAESQTYSFLGLYPEKSYNIYSFITETGTHLESETSPALNVITALTYSLDDSYCDKQGIKYTLNSSDKTATVTSGTGANTEDIIIPKYVWHNGVQYKVTAVNSNAFLNCSVIKTVTISDTVTSIGYKAFYGCSNLKEAYFDGAAPTAFGANVFDGTSSNFAIYYYKHQAGWKENIVNAKYNGYYAVPRNGIEEIEIANGANSGYVLAIVDRSGNPIPEAEVEFDGQNGISDENGYIFFKKPSESTTEIHVFGTGFYPYDNQEHIVNSNLLLDFVVLNVDPSHVIPISCNQKDIATGVAQINNTLDISAEIRISGESEFEIEGYSIIQDNVVLATDKNGKFEIPNKDFQAGKQVIGVLHTSYGVDIEKVLNINVVSYKFLNAPISLGKDISFTIPKKVPLIGGNKMDIEFDAFLGNVIIDNNCIKVGYGIDVVDKDITKIRKDLWELRKEKASKVSYGNFKTNIAGYYIAYFDSTGVFKEEGQLLLSVEISYTYAQEFVAVVVPIVVEVKISASGEIEFNFKYDMEKAKWIMPEINLELAAALKASAGVGCRAVSAGIYGQGSVTFDFRLHPEAYTREIYMGAALGLYAKGSVPWKWKFEKELIGDDHIVLYQGTPPESKKALLLNDSPYQATAMISEIYEEENYILIPRDYLETRSAWLYGASSNTRSSNVSENNKTLQTSVFDNIEPQIISCSDTTMMLYIDDNGVKDEYNSTDLVYSIYDASNNIWSEPQSVDGNNFVDGYVDVYSDGTDIYVVYVESNRTMTANDKMSDYSAAAEIAVTKFDFETGKFETPTVLTNNSTIDMLPRIAVINSIPTVIWVNNADNDMFGMTANNSLLVSRYTNGFWSTPTELVSSSPSITSTALGTLESTSYVAFTKDIDCDLSTEEDSVVCLVDLSGNIIEVETETDANFNVQFASFDGISRLVWFNSNNLNFISAANATVVPMFENPVFELTSNYQLVANNKNKFDVLFTNSVENGSDVYGIFFDGKWSMPVRVTKTESDRYIDAFSASYIGDKLLIPYLSTAVTFAEDDFSTSSNLCFTTVDFGYDLCIESAEIDYDKLLEEKTGLLEFVVTNNGLSKIESVKIDIPELSYSQSKSITIMPGETAELSVDFNLPDTITADKLSVYMTPTDKTDINPSDNSTSFKIGFTDFDVNAEQKIVGNINYVLVSVTNNGNISGSGSLQAIKGDTDGEVIYELAVENLAIGETRYYMIKTDSSFFDAGETSGAVTVKVSIDEDEYFSFNNDCCVMIYNFEDEIVDYENLVPNSSIGATSAVFDKYVPQDITVEIDANGNTFEGITELSTDNYTSGENVTISKSYLSTLEVGSYDFTFVFRASDTQTQERVFTVIVEDSSPVAPEISGEQISVSVYDGNAIEEDVDFAVYTNSDGAVTFSYSSDNGVTWTSGLPVLAGTYLIKADVAATEEYVASSTQFTVTISKAGRAIPSPAAITVTNSSVSLTTVIPTVFESEDTVYYGYSSTNDASTVNNWSLNPVFDGLNANTEYYFFAKVTGGNNYADVISVATSVKTSKNSVDAPTAPVLSSKTDTSVTLVSADGYEYRCNDGEWQSSSVFEGLKPNQSYSFTQRIAETENSYASAPSAALVVTTNKSVTQAPEAPDIEGKTDTTVTLSHSNGYEYKCNDGVWTDSNIFTGLNRNTEYSFYQRVAETDTSYASESSEALTVITDKTELSGTVVINGIAQTAENLTADVSAVKPAEAQFTYQWYSDGNAISGETSTEYTVTYNDLGHEISVEVTGINDFKGTLRSSAVIPVAASANGIVSIEGDPVYGNELTATVTELNPSYAEYAMQWYRGDTPIGGETKEKYTVAKEDIGQQITVRITGVNGYDISVLSAGVIPVKQTVDAPQAPKAETVTSDSITLVSNDGYEYRIGNGEWQSANVFTSDSNGNALMPDTEYAFSQRVKETETAFASAESEIAVIRTKSIRVESISISDSNVEMIKTYSYQLSASVSPENATDKNVIWLSSDESIAMVDQNGFVSAIESGNAVITAKSVDGGFTATCDVTVIPDIYTVTWNVNGEKTTQEVRYSEYITAPPNPVADGYEFIGWTPEIPQTMPLYDLEFTAVFEPIEYYAEFVADGVTVSRVPYNVETVSINEPVVPDKTGYSGKWENYEFTIGGITVNAVYTVNNYKVTWIVDGKETQMSANYGESIDKSFVPQKDGYKFMGWTPDVPQTMPARDLTFTAVFEKSYICPDCGDEVLGEDAINNHIASEARMKATVKIKNNSGSKTIKYGETLRLTAITTNMPADAKIYWYVDGVKKGEGETFNVSISNGSVEVTVKVVDANGNAIINANGIEISDSEKVSVNSSFWQKIVSFFKNLFGMNRTVVQAFKGVF